MSSLTEPEGVARNMLIVSTTLTGLTILEYAWNVRFEMRVIWPKFWKSAEAKIFVMARYLGLAGQIFNVWFVNRMTSGTPNHPLACRVWYSYQIVTMQWLLMSVELLLMLRVCEMYKNDKYVLGILFVFAGTQCAAMAVAARMVVPGLGSSPACVVVDAHPGQIYAGASNIAVHLGLLAMILRRYFSGNWQEPLRSYFKITVRNSTCTVIAVTGIFLLVMLAPLGLHSQTIENVLFLVMVFTFWFATGRLVLDKEKFCQEFQNGRDFTEVDLDNLEPPTISYNSTVIHNKVHTAVNSKSGLETEEDITDERAARLGE